LRVLFGNVWALVCFIAVGSCASLAIQLIFRTLPFGDQMGTRARIMLTIPALFGALAGLYGIFASVLLSIRYVRMRRLNSNLRSAQQRARDLESLRFQQQARLEELSMLREVATIVNQESDFTIIAEKVLELITGLLEPADCAIFLLEDGQQTPQPFARWTRGKVATDGKVRDYRIPGLDMSAFERHSIVCRVYNGQLHAIVPLRVEENILGVLFLAFASDQRPTEVQAAEFNETRRPVLQEITHHISLAVKTKHLHTKAVVDGLTQLYSRSHFNSQLPAAIELVERTGEALSMIVADIDHFKHVNDTYGHATGDVVLSRVASRIQRALRKYDTAYRYGGEEIAILLPRSRLKQAAGIAERLRRLIESQKVRGAEGKLVQVTVSLGVAQYQAGDDATKLFQRADRRLYRAKSNGRNQVVPAPASTAA